MTWLMKHWRSMPPYRPRWDEMWLGATSCYVAITFLSLSAAFGEIARWAPVARWGSNEQWASALLIFGAVQVFAALATWRWARVGAALAQGCAYFAFFDGIRISHMPSPLVGLPLGVALAQTVFVVLLIWRWR